MTSLARHLQANDHNVTVMRNSPAQTTSTETPAHTGTQTDFINVRSATGGLPGLKDYRTCLKSLLRVRRFHVVVFSCGPFYAIRLGPWIRRKYAQEYIIEQRDLWLFRQLLQPKPVYYRVLRRLAHFGRLPAEHHALTRALGMVVVCPPDQQVMRRRYPRSANKIHCILNGYDELGLGADVSSRSESPYLAYFGKFSYYGLKHVRQVLEGLGDVIQSGQEIRLLHIGEPEGAVEQIAAEVGLPPGTVLNTGYVDYAVGMALVAGSIAGIVSGSYMNAYGTKVFDYIGANVPIIASVEPNSGLARFIEKANGGWLCHSREDVKTAVLKALRQDTTELGLSNRQQYSRRAANQQYERLIVRLVQRGPSPSNHET
ncbi:MAG: glycosyltransferase [Micrococcales bacterium]|nr:glycosyltransferase [Micrococcales bacterium]